MTQTNTTKTVQNIVSPAGLAEQSALLSDELTTAWHRVLDSGWFVLGTEVSQFETNFAAWCNTSECVSVASGTEALQLACMALDIGPGDEVIIPANALPTAYGVAATGADLVFADCRLDDLNIDPKHVAELISDRTRAIVAVHLYGHPADIEALQDAVGNRQITIIEDCAQAHGATYRDVKVGGLTSIAAWSFYPTKNLGALGDAGAITTNDAKLADRIRSLRMYGEQQRYISAEFGINSRMDELQAALLSVKLNHLDDWIASRRRVANQYDAILGDVNGVVIPPCTATVQHARHLYPIQVQNRDVVLDALRACGVPAAIHYPLGSHLQPCLQQFSRGGLPVTEQLSRDVVSLPMHPHITDDQAAQIAEATLAVITSL